MSTIVIDSRAAMYRDDAMRVLAIVDTQNDTVTISNTLPYMPPKDPFKGKTPAQIEKIKELQRQSIVVVDVSDAFNDWDMHFKEFEHLDDAVRAYRSLVARHCLILKNEVAQRYSPENVIQVRKMDMNGNQFELDSESITNGHVAVLMACWSATKALQTASIHSENETVTQDDQDDFLVPFSA